VESGKEKNGKRDFHAESCLVFLTNRDGKSGNSFLIFWSKFFDPADGKITQCSLKYRIFHIKIPIKPHLPAGTFRIS